MNRIAATPFRPVQLDDATPLHAYLEPGGFLLERGDEGVVAIGESARIDVPAGDDHVLRAAEAAAVARDAGAQIVVGALPFDGRGKSTLFVPRVAVVRRGGETVAWCAPGEVPPDSSAFAWAGRADRAGDAGGADRAGAEPVVLSVEPEQPPSSYVDAVRKARDAILDGGLEKVVLARSVLARATGPLDRTAILRRLHAADPGAYTFAANGMIGATPELLVERRGEVVRARPLAGSARRGATLEADEAAAQALLRSAKDRAEHAFVATAARDALAAVCERVDAGEPELHATSRVWHLATEIDGVLQKPAPDALALAALLHPTPAVCGTPRDAALDAIRALEPMDRGLYAGIVGWVDAEGDGEWVIALRCAEVHGAEARLFAGAGVVAGSDPEAELAETDAKLEVLLSALGV